jgi:hypothetical protein
MTQATLYSPQRRPLSVDELTELAGTGEIVEIEGTTQCLRRAMIRWPNLRLNLYEVEPRPGVDRVQQVLRLVAIPAFDTTCDRVLRGIALRRRALIVREAVAERRRLSVVAPMVGRVHHRALALLAIAQRALMGLGVVHDDELVNLLSWLHRHDLAGELETNERALLVAPLGQERGFHVGLTSWRTEGAALLAWSLGLLELPRFDERADRTELHTALGFLAPRLPTGLQVRAPHELTRMAHQISLVHWRLRAMPARRIDLAHKARDRRGSAVDLTGVPLIDGDLAIQGIRIAEAPVEAIDRSLLIVKERHRAINWLLGSAERYDEVITAT